MLRISIPQISDKVLFETTLEPSISTVEKLLKEKEIGEGEIDTISGRKNKIAVGVPYYENLISRLIEEKQEIPHEIKQTINDYDFHFISLSCSFLPDNRCKFIWARFGVELNAISKEANKLLEEKPIAYDMFPDEVLSKIIYRKDISLSPELKLELSTIKTDMKLGKLDTQKEFFFYEPQIFAFGLLRPSVAWDFKSTTEKGIWGNKRNLLLIVKTPKNSKLKGRFIFSAEIEVNVGKLIRIAYRKRKDEIIDVEYDLSA
jgi:hypothetical protein